MTIQKVWKTQNNAADLSNNGFVLINNAFVLTDIGVFFTLGQRLTPFRIGTQNLLQGISLLELPNYPNP